MMGGLKNPEQIAKSMAGQKGRGKESTRDRLRRKLEEKKVKEGN